MSIGSLDIEFAKLIKALKSQPHANKILNLESFAYEGNLIFTGPNYTKYKKLISKLREDKELYHVSFDWNKDFMKDFRILIENIIQDTELKPDEIKQKFNDFIAELREPIGDWNIFLTISGVNFDKQDQISNKLFSANFNYFEIIKFNPLHEATLKIWDEMNAIWTSLGFNESDKIREWTYITSNLSRGLIKKELYFLKFQIKSNNSHTAFRKAKLKASIIFALINLLYGEFNRSAFYAKFRVHAYFDKISRFIGISNQLKKINQIAFSSPERKEPATNFSFTPELIMKYNTSLQTKGILNKVFQENQENNLVVRLERMLYWYFQAYKSFNLNNRLSNIIYSLETMFIPERNIKHKGAILAFRLMLFEHISLNLFYYPHQIFSMYELRSDIVHGSYKLEDDNITYKTEWVEINFYEKEINSLLSRTGETIRKLLDYTSTNQFKDITSFIDQLYENGKPEEALSYIIKNYNKSKFRKFYEKYESEVINNIRINRTI